MRASGILMPIFSLCGKYGIGCFGEEAYNFIDFLSKAGQSYWQVLPLGPTSFGDSPYQSFSAFAGNPYFVDLTYLQNNGYITENELNSFDFGSEDDKIDYAALYNSRFKIFSLACSRFELEVPKEFKEFYEQNSFWLEDYALFMAIKNELRGKSWCDWPAELRDREADALNEIRRKLSSEIGMYRMIQYFFFKQWDSLKTYANDKGISIIGDMPIYVSYDSCDVWCNREMFQLDSDGKPTAVAGCPPDAFSEDGQLWGNPLYNWDKMKNATQPYSWWIQRTKFAVKMFDMVRIDHFRGFDSYFSIPANAKTAADGEWCVGPGAEFFKIIESKLGRLPLIAEDLGILTDSVRQMLDETGYPGMKVMQFAFDHKADSSYLPHNCIKNCVLYTGTHDNDTIIGWKNNLDEEDLKFAKSYMRISSNDAFNWEMIRIAMSSTANTVIFQMQDFLGLGSEGRINIPSTVGQNWCWRITDGCINNWLAGIIREITEIYRRIPKE